jgi:hypothetical protein
MGYLRTVPTAFLAIIAASPAMATAGFDCEIDDASLSFLGGGTMGRGMGSPIIDFSAQTTLKLKDSPVGANKVDLSKSLVHHWAAGGDLSLHLYWERGDTGDASFELVIQTKITDDALTYEGGYRLIVSGANADPLEVSGKATCSAG